MPRIGILTSGGIAPCLSASIGGLIEKYNEMYGNDAYEQDGNRVSDALMPDGRRIRHHQLLPELSSPPRN